MTEITCTVCPRGCRLTVEIENQKVTGNSCARGQVYGLAEVTNPTRTLTTTVGVVNGAVSRLPVKTSLPIPKAKIQEAMSRLAELSVCTPVKIGDVILHDILGTGADVIACKNMEQKGSN